MRKTRALAMVIAGIAATSTLIATPAAVAAPGAADRREYTVLVADGADRAAAAAAVTAAGGQVVRENAAVGVLVVQAPATGFVEQVTASDAVLGAAHAQPVGRNPVTPRGGTGTRDAVEQEHHGAGQKGSGGAPGPIGLDPLDVQRWELALINADKARVKQPGDRRVQVGILDSGIDGSHPDLAPNLDRSLSRNFVIDIPVDEFGNEIDGPCEFAGCVDPVDRDDNGHGTHVAGIVAAAANGVGMSGVAPNVTLVNIRGGQDSGFLFLQPVVDALTYGADAGLDVINMSFYVDPWLYNCPSNPADSPEAQIEQRTVIAAMNRALRYAHRKGVTLVGSLGNNHEDLGRPRTDTSSPDFPLGQTYDRPVDNATCVDLPAEGPHVIGVSAVGPSKAKADYSNYGVEQISVAAPGGYFRDGFGTPTFRTNGNLVLSTYPLAVLQAQGSVDAAGNVTPDGAALGVQKACGPTGCGFYAYLQGTSMASPHAVGVAALIVSQFGLPDPRHPGHRFLPPIVVEQVLLRTAADQACAAPVVSYANEGRPAEFDAPCEGTTRFNGHYGEGIVDALAAVTLRGRI